MGFNEMDLKDLINYGLGLLVLVFNFGVYFKKLVSLPAKEEVNKMIETQLRDYATQRDLKEIISWRNEIKDEIIKIKICQEHHKEKLLVTTDSLKYQISEIRMNLKTLFSHLGLEYINNNNKE